jgi:tRNA(Ile)-lysidine synthase TilS/MesJ
MKSAEICTNCILPANFPNVSFDENGVCNHCRSFKGVELLEESRKKYEKHFLELIEKYKGKSDYDVLMCYSGGKDSTYTMKLFKRKYNLSVLAVTFDNGFISPKAVENMSKVVEVIGVDHIIFKIRFDLLKKVFATAATEELYPKKTLERASTICTSCISFVKFIALKTALEKEIPFIGYGWSPGQAPIQSSLLKTNPALIRMTQKVMYAPLHKVVGDDVNPYFLGEKHFRKSEDFPYNVHPLAFLEYNEGKIIETLNKLGWEKPDDTDPNSTNCLLNAFANEVHEKRYGYNPYVFEIAKMVREGVMKREEGLMKFSASVPAELVNFAKKRLMI